MTAVHRLTSPPSDPVRAPDDRALRPDRVMDRALDQALDQALGPPLSTTPWPGSRVAGPEAGPTPVRVALVADGELVAAGLAALLARHADRVELVGLSRLLPASGNLVLVDVCGPCSAGPRRVSELVEGGHRTVFTFGAALSFEERASLRAAGARGHVSVALSAEQLVTALEQAGRLPGPSPLPDRPPAEDRPRSEPRDGRALLAIGCTPREAEVVTLVCRGLSNTEIAEELYLGINTVKTYIRHAYRKVGLTSRTQVVVWGLTRGV